MKERQLSNECMGCKTNCCDHFILENWSSEKLESLIKKYDFLKVAEHWQGEDGLGTVVDAWVMECERLQDDGSCRDYPADRPYFCDWAGVRYKPASGCKLFEKTVAKNPDRSE